MRAQWKNVKLSSTVNPVLPSPEAEWAAATFRPQSALEAVLWDSIRSEWEGAACTVSWDVPVRVGDDFAPGGLSREFSFWRDVLYRPPGPYHHSHMDEGWC